MVSIGEETFGFQDKVIGKIRDFLDDSESTQGGLMFVQPFC